jgi:hypothetical protein
MGWPLALMGAGIALNVIGNYRANMEKADAEAANAAFYREQAAFAKETGERAERISERQYQRLYGEQVGAFASAGVDIGSGSALDVLAESRVIQMEERAAIRKEASMNVRLAMLRSDAAMSASASYSDSTNNLLQAGGSILSGAGMMAR